jgi:hypothetical protein
MHVLPNIQLPKIPLVQMFVPTENPKYPIPLVEPVEMLAGDCR